ncbi:MAG: hypothetical protein KBB37_05875 [Bacteroidia bacterium]|nr:hypothetical protein [Bacteroidia bacterium]MBP7260797.1 hypothetical protein [Bacteroidia bacterium]MBP9180275.1 hypothetical protein [Bacteroidia bacterium]MBP9724665.1 hypothetical protein [Bacteroidia bacterium]
MKHWDKKSFIKDLSDFISLVEQYDLPVDISKIYTFQSKFEYDAGYIVDIKDVVFNVNSKISGTIPNEVVNLSIYLDHVCEFDQDKDIAIYDRIKSNYVFRLKLIGRDGDKKEYINCWRLDQDQEGDNEHKTLHPYYHFQSGGDELIATDTGSNLFLSAPRLGHPPMDLFLGFHFILNNFYSKKQYSFVNTLLNNDTYQDIIDRAQQRLWEPYFSSFKENSTHTSFNMSKVFPLYMKINK